MIKQEFTFALLGNDITILEPLTSLYLSDRRDSPKEHEWHSEAVQWLDSAINEGRWHAVSALVKCYLLSIDSISYSLLQASQNNAWQTVADICRMNYSDVTIPLVVNEQKFSVLNYAIANNDAQIVSGVLLRNNQLSLHEFNLTFHQIQARGQWELWLQILILLQASISTMDPSSKQELSFLIYQSISKVIVDKYRFITPDALANLILIYARSTNDDFTIPVEWLPEVTYIFFELGHPLKNELINLVGDSDKPSILYRLAKEGNFKEAIKWLPPTIEDNDYYQGLLCFAISSSGGHEIVKEILLNRSLKLASIRNEQGLSLFSIALQSQNLHNLAILAKHAPSYIKSELEKSVVTDIQKDILIKPELILEPAKALSSIYCKNSIDQKLIDILFFSNSNINLNMSIDDDLNTLLHKAILANNSSLIYFLIAKGVNTNVQNKAGLTPLMLAVDNQLEPQIIAHLAHGFVDLTLVDGTHTSIAQRLTQVKNQQYRDYIYNSEQQKYANYGEYLLLSLQFYDYQQYSERYAFNDKNESPLECATRNKNLYAVAYLINNDLCHAQDIVRAFELCKSYKDTRFAKLINFDDYIQNVSTLGAAQLVMQIQQLDQKTYDSIWWLTKQGTGEDFLTKAFTMISSSRILNSDKVDVLELLLNSKTFNYCFSSTGKHYEKVRQEIESKQAKSISESQKLMQTKAQFLKNSNSLMQSASGKLVSAFNPYYSSIQAQYDPKAHDLAPLQPVIEPLHQTPFLADSIRYPELAKYESTVQQYQPEYNPDYISSISSTTVRAGSSLLSVDNHPYLALAHQETHQQLTKPEPSAPPYTPIINYQPNTQSQELAASPVIQEADSTVAIARILGAKSDKTLDVTAQSKGCTTDEKVVKRQLKESSVEEYLSPPKISPKLSAHGRTTLLIASLPKPPTTIPNIKDKLTTKKKKAERTLVTI